MHVKFGFTSAAAQGHCLSFRTAAPPAEAGGVQEVFRKLCSTVLADSLMLIIMSITVSSLDHQLNLANQRDRCWSDV